LRKAQQRRLSNADKTQQQNAFKTNSAFGSRSGFPKAGTQLKLLLHRTGRVTAGGYSMGEVVGWFRFCGYLNCEFNY
jgi:hypothetical protein